MTINLQIQTHIKTLLPGEPFTPKSLLRYGTRSHIDQVLTRLVRQGLIQREARGVYSKPIISRFTQQPIPSPLPKVLETIAQTNHETIALHGAVAANYFELSTQNQLRPVYLTTGRSRVLTIGHQKVVLKHVSQKHLPLGNSKAGLAITAMRYLGRQGMNAALLQKIQAKLEPSEWQQVTSALGSQPAWLISLVQHDPSGIQHG